LLSPYLDGAVTETRCWRCRSNLDGMRGACMRENKGAAADTTTADECAACAGTSGPWAELRLAFAGGGGGAAPPYEGLRMRAENAVNAFMVPATAGLACALLIFGFSHWDSGNAGEVQAEQ